MSASGGNSRELVQGNEACARGALYAGCSFYAGYPITPASEVMEILCRLLPDRGGQFIQMEDEIASISAITGAVWGGAKAMTATSGPGFSLMQEGLGFAAITETPCVVVNVQRWGPATGQPTKPSQGDLMQAIWGTHGDHPVIVLTASSVQDIFETTVEAFNLAETYRSPVVLLFDETTAHMREDIEWPELGQLEVVERTDPDTMDLEEYIPFGDDTFVPLGAGKRFMVSGLAHDGTGHPVQGFAAGALLERLVGKIRDHADDIARYDTVGLEDATTVVVSYGVTSRAVRGAVEQLRREDVAVGMIDLTTLWPFPDVFLDELGDGLERLIVPELNLGQLVREVRRAVQEHPDVDLRVEQLSRVDGALIEPDQIVRAVMEPKSSNAHTGASSEGTR